MSKEVYIGKKIIDVLTSKMYRNPLIIYREYIQNSIDSIENAITNKYLKNREQSNIHVLVDTEGRTVEIVDNGEGLQKRFFFETLTKIADSEKSREKHIGQIGIGRLAGLAYCSELIMESSYKGESTKSVLRWDCKELKALLESTTRLTASELLNEVITLSELKEDVDCHYFKVKMRNVNNDTLLNVNDVYEYVCENCPLPFRADFYYKEKIYSELNKLGLSMNEYPVFINDMQATKSYKTVLYKRVEDPFKKKKVDDIKDIDLKIFKGSNDEALAFCWYTISGKLQSIERINNPGIKYRKMNMQVGGADSLRSFFTQPRFSNYFIGELHIIPKQISPNSQRDYFQDSPLLQELNSILTPFFKDLSELCYKASEVNSNVRKIKDANTAVELFNKNKVEKKFLTVNHEKEVLKEVEEKQKLAEKAKQKLGKIIDKSPEGYKPIIKVVAKNAMEEAGGNLKDLSGLNNPSDISDTYQNGKDVQDISKFNDLVNKLSKLSRREKKVLSFVLDTIRDKVNSDDLEKIIRTIGEKYS